MARSIRLDRKEAILCLSGLQVMLSGDAGTKLTAEEQEIAILLSERLERETKPRAQRMLDLLREAAHLLIADFSADAEKSELQKKIMAALPKKGSG